MFHIALFQYKEYAVGGGSHLEGLAGRGESAESSVNEKDSKVRVVRLGKQTYAYQRGKVGGGIN